MEIPADNPKNKIKKVLELPKINQDSIAYSLLNPSEKKPNKQQDPNTSHQIMVEVSKPLKTEPLATRSTKSYFFHDNAIKTQKFKDSRKELNEKKFLSFTTFKGFDPNTWKHEELKKWQENKKINEFNNLMVTNEKNHKKLALMNYNISTKSNLNHVDFSKLAKTQTQMFPKPEVSEEKIKENLKELVGIHKYPLEYQEIGFSIPQKNFISFEPLKTHLVSFKESSDRKSTFEKQITENIHKTSHTNNKTSTFRREIMGLAQWLDQASNKIFEKTELSLEEQIANTQNIYTICIKELVAMISMECQERGLLLENIWDTHISLVNACLLRYEKEKTSQYNKFLSEIEKIKVSYSDCFDSLMKENKEMHTIVEDRDFSMKKLIYDNNSLKRREARLNKTIKSLGAAVGDLKEMLDSVLAENIKLKLSKDEEHNLRKGERDILKKQYEEMVKGKTRAKNEIFQRLEKLMSPAALMASPSRIISSQLTFAFDQENSDGIKDNTASLGTLKDILIKEEDEELNFNDDFEDIAELFVKEIGVDTKDLLPVNNKETTTRDLSKYFSKEESAQTVYFDEINEENENPDYNTSDERRSISTVSPSKGGFRGSFVNNDNILLENMVESKLQIKGSPLEKQVLIKKRMFSFSSESLQHLENFKEIQSYTLTGICIWYSQEIETFFNILRIFTQNINQDNFHEVLQGFDWESFPNLLQNILLIHEQFIQNIKNRDTTRSKEILQHKIELLERKIEMDEAEKMRNLFRNNYSKLREKFEEFYKMTIQIQSMQNDDEFPNQNSLNPNAQSAEIVAKRRKSLTVLPDEKKEFLEKIFENSNKRKVKTMIKEKKKPTNIVIKKPEEENSPLINKEEPIPLARSRTNIKKFEDISEKVLESKKIVNFSIKKPKDLTDIIPNQENSNSLHSIELKPPPLTPSMQVFSSSGQKNSFLIGGSESFSDFKQIEEEKSSKIRAETVKLRNNQPEEEKEVKNRSETIKLSSIKKKMPQEKFMKMNQSYMVKGFVSNLGHNHTNEMSFDVKNTLELIDREKNEVLRLEEKKLKEKQEFKDMIANEKMIDLINQANNVLPQKKSWDKINSQNADKCYAFLHRVEVSEILPSKKVTLSTILKTISQLLTELIKLKQKKQGNFNPLFFILYEFLFQRYGNMRERAEAKMIKIFQGCVSHLDLPRVRNFSRLLSILPDKNNSLTKTYDGNDLEFYLNYFCLLDDHPMSNIPGIMLAMSPQEHAFTALAKALEIFTRYCNNYNNIFSKVKIESYVNQIKAVKIDDPIVSRKYVVDVDFVIEKIFELRNEAFKIYKIPFLAVDIDYNEALNINEFMLLIRNIERNKYSEKQIVELFKNEYDFYDEEKEEKCMSFKRFAFICEKENIIGIKKQEEFVSQITDEVRNIKQLKDEWDVKKNLIKLKLIKTNYYNSFYIKVLKIIEAHLQVKNAQDEEENKKVWMQYRIIDEESNAFLLQFEAECCLPKEFNLISEKAGEIF